MTDLYKDLGQLSHTLESVKNTAVQSLVTSGACNTVPGNTDPCSLVCSGSNSQYEADVFCHWHTKIRPRLSNIVVAMENLLDTQVSMQNTYYLLFPIEFAVYFSYEHV